MAYSVLLTPQAVSDVDSAVEYLIHSAPRRAAPWLQGLMEAVLSLSELPQRCPLAPEAATLGVELRQLLYGRRAGVYRILFRIYEAGEDKPVVRVVAIRHGARGRVPIDDLEGTMTEDDGNT